MAITAYTPKAELLWQLNQLFTGQTYKVFLALNPGGSLTPESSRALWEAEELSGNGYTAFTGTVGAPVWSTENSRYEIPVIDVQWTADGGVLTFDAVVTVVGSRTQCVNVALLDAPLALQPGASKAYQVLLGKR